MKKPVQIVTVPLNTRSNFGLFKDVEDDEIIFSETSIKDNPYFLPQQLLVFSDDEIQAGDYVINNLDNLHGISTRTLNEGEKRDKEYSKVIASYPNIQGTFTLCKDTIQEWIDSGAPKECSIEMLEYESETYGMVIIKVI